MSASKIVTIVEDTVLSHAPLLVDFPAKDVIVTDKSDSEDEGACARVSVTVCVYVCHGGQPV